MIDRSPGSYRFCSFFLYIVGSAATSSTRRATATKRNIIFNRNKSKQKTKTNSQPSRKLCKNLWMGLDGWSIGEKLNREALRSPVSQSTCKENPPWLFCFSESGLEAPTVLHAIEFLIHAQTVHGSSIFSPQFARQFDAALSFLAQHVSLSRIIVENWKLIF